MTAEINISELRAGLPKMHNGYYRVTLRLLVSGVLLDLHSTGTDPLVLMSWAYGRATDFLRRGR